MTALTDHAAIRRRILTHALDHPDDPIPFSLRLQREQGWSRARTARAIAEYRRFIELAMVAGHPVSPSPTVDAVWHLHLTDTRRYWDDFCPNVLGRLLHHDPSRGGVAERARHDDQYRRTLAAYARVFDVVPPEAGGPRLFRLATTTIVMIALMAVGAAAAAWVFRAPLTRTIVRWERIPAPPRSPEPTLPPALAPPPPPDLMTSPPALHR